MTNTSGPKWPFSTVTVALLALILALETAFAVIAKRQPMTIDEIEENELPGLIKKEHFVAVLYHDDSQVCKPIKSSFVLFSGPFKGPFKCRTLYI